MMHADYLRNDRLPAGTWILEFQTLAITKLKQSMVTESTDR